MMGLTTYTYHLHGQLQLPIPTTTMVHWEYLYLSRCIENTYTYHYHGPLRVPIPITVHWKYLYLPLPRQIPITFIHGILRTKFNFDFSWPHIQSSPRVDVKMMLVLLHVHKKIDGIFEAGHLFFCPLGVIFDSCGSYLPQEFVLNKPNAQCKPCQLNS